MGDICSAGAATIAEIPAIADGRLTGGYCCCEGYCLADIGVIWRDLEAGAFNGDTARQKCILLGGLTGIDDHVREGGAR